MRKRNITFNIRDMHFFSPPLFPVLPNNQSTISFPPRKKESRKKKDNLLFVRPFFSSFLHCSWRSTLDGESFPLTKLSIVCECEREAQLVPKVRRRESDGNIPFRTWKKVYLLKIYSPFVCSSSFLLSFFLSFFPSLHLPSFDQLSKLEMAGKSLFTYHYMSICPQVT